MNTTIDTLLNELRQTVQQRNRALRDARDARAAIGAQAKEIRRLAEVEPEARKRVDEAILAAVA